MEDVCGKANRTIFKAIDPLFCRAYSQTMNLRAQTIKAVQSIGGIKWHTIIRRGVSQKNSVDQMKQAAIHPGSISAKHQCARIKTPHLMAGRRRSERRILTAIQTDRCRIKRPLLEIIYKRGSKLLVLAAKI